MTSQASLFDTAAAARDIGMERAAVHAGESWQQECLVIARDYCERHEYVFVDDLWAWGLETGESDRALGAVIQLAARLGWIEKIPMRSVHPEAYVSRPSVRSNLSPKPVWRSLIYRTPAPSRSEPAVGSGD